MQHRGKQTEQINCVCGVTQATPGAEQYNGMWLQCDDCLSWLHGACVGYPKRAPKGALLPSVCMVAYAVLMILTLVTTILMIHHRF